MRRRMAGAQARAIAQALLEALPTRLLLRRPFVVLQCAVDRGYPALAPLHPGLVVRLQLEGRVVQTPEPDLDERVVRVGRVKEPRPTARAEAATVIARDLAAQLKRLHGPVRIHGEGAAGLLPAICAVATADMHRVTANAVADRSAKTPAGAYYSLHARVMLRNTVMRERG